LNDDFKHDHQDLLSQIISGSPIPTFVIDRNHRVTHYNKACEVLTGSKAEEIIGTDGQWRAFYAEKRPVMADIVLDTAVEDMEGMLETHYQGKFRASSVRPGAFEARDFFPALGEDGKWLFFTAAPIRNASGEVIGAIETLQDITQEKRVSSLNRAMLRVSKALPRYSYLDDLLSFISQEIKKLLGAEGALVLLLESETNELYTSGLAYDDPDREKRMKEIRFSLDEVLAGQVIRTGQPVVMHDAEALPRYAERDRKTGYITRSLLEVPLVAEDRTIGVLAGINKKKGRFSGQDMDALAALAGTVALAVENTRYQEGLRAFYREVQSLNAAKGKAILHLSHELKTPVAILFQALPLLEDELAVVPEDNWKPYVEIIERQLNRIVAIESEVSDIITNKEYKVAGLLNGMVLQCADLLSVLALKNQGKKDLVDQITTHIRELFSPKIMTASTIDPGAFIQGRLRALEPGFAHRQVDVRVLLEPTRPIQIPEVIFEKVMDGLIRNAIENTPDEGRVDVTVFEKGGLIQVSVKDYGVGIRKDHQARIFEGFFPTQDILAYSTRKPFDFNAGGKGADLLRMKIFSETWGFALDMASTRCPLLDGPRQECPGRISSCPSATTPRPCHESGGTEFILFFHGA